MWHIVWQYFFLISSTFVHATPVTYFINVIHRIKINNSAVLIKVAGLKEGEKKAMRGIAKNLLKMGIELEKIAQASGLSMQEIQMLKND